ncbi:MAG: urocanate hydratase [Proteobacteria bacterium]|nr:urocanate hydratase [Pseudomonadota bacterium]
MISNKTLKKSMTVTLDDLFERLPPPPVFRDGIRRAPRRSADLSRNEVVQALKNALRYIPEKWHRKMAPEFLNELSVQGRIYGYRFRPRRPLRGKSIDAYPGNCLEGKAFQVMIDNNLDLDVALYPHELVTYGETGQVCQNWMQYRLIKRYLELLSGHQTLVVSSGHPVGLFDSFPESPRVIITNGLMVGFADNPDNFNRAAAMGVANYGQMTAGGWMYIGPQGIVHGTYNTLMNAGRLKLGIKDTHDLSGRLFVSSGLGGMSGAQGKAIEIANGVGIIAEVDYSRIETRHSQGWVSHVADHPDDAFDLAEEFKKRKKHIAIAYYGNIVDLLEYAVEKNIPIDLLSDQTSCHVVYEGGYCPQGISFEERTAFLESDRVQFRKHVNTSLKKHFQLIKKLSGKGTYFFDYGNSFLKAIFDSGVREVCRNGKDTRDGFVFPSYVEDIMGPLLFDYGFGPFRWVCLSGRKEDLLKTDQAAMSCIDAKSSFQNRDNFIWIRDAKKHRMVVGTKARILYQDAAGRTQIALTFNRMIRNGEIGPVMLGRDHHDTGGTDSPFRETANIKDGSNIMADMATQCFAGNAARGMSMVSLHNGGGVGIGNAINGGFGLVLDGSRKKDDIIRKAITWDVMGGVARRAWAGNGNAILTAVGYNKDKKGEGCITLPFGTDSSVLEKLVDEVLSGKKGHPE